MKPKYRQLIRVGLPALIIVPALWSSATAATITPDTTGNVTPATGGAHNIVTTSGATFLGGGPKVIQINPGIVLNPAGVDVITIDVFDSVGASYTIINNGTLQADNGNSGIDTAESVDSNPSIAVVNSSIISGGGGIRANNQLQLTNTGSITANNAFDAAVFAKDGSFGTGIVNQFGATVTANAHGIQGENGSIMVDNHGTVTSNGVDGIHTTGTIDLTNRFTDTLGGTLYNTAAIVTGARNGVFASGANASIRNSGFISGTSGAGIQIGDDGTIRNFDSLLSPNSFTGASISGNTGVIAGEGLELNNSRHSNVTGTTEGIVLGSGLVVNEGEIEGLGGNGIRATSADPSQSFELQNRGYLYGLTNAFTGGAGDSNLLFQRDLSRPYDPINDPYEGSLVIGDLVGGAGLNTLTFRNGLNDVNNPYRQSNVLAGDVLGWDVINKDGTGTAFIGESGENYDVDTNQINITGGGLYINGDISNVTLDPGEVAALTVINANGAAVGGTGIWAAAANLNSGGISAGSIPINLADDPEDAIGTLVLNGPVIHSGSSFIRMDLSPTFSDGDLIQQQAGLTNTYTLSSTDIRVSTTDMNTPIAPGTYVIVNSANPILGTFGDLTVQVNLNTPDTGFQSTAWQQLVAANALDPNVTTLNVAGTLFSEFAGTLGFSPDGTDLLLGVDYNFGSLAPLLTENQLALGTALLDGSSLGDPGARDLFAALLFSDVGTVLVQLQSMIGEGEAALATSAMVMNSNYRIHRTIQDHLADSRSSGERTVTSAAPAATDAKGGMEAKGATVQQPSSTTVASRGSAWGSFSYDHQSLEGGSFDGHDGDTGAITAGFDYRVAPNFLLGILLDGSKTDPDIGGDVDSFRVAVYGTYGAPLGLYADFLLGYGTHDMDFTDASSWQALATVGYSMGNDKVKHGPFVGVEWQNFDVDGFDSGLVDVDDFDVDSLRGLVGYRVNADLGRFRPYASVAYAHEFEDGRPHADASIFGNSFRLRGAEQGSAILVGLGTGIGLTDSLSMSVGYRGEISVESEGLDSHGGYLGVKWNF